MENLKKTKLLIGMATDENVDTRYTTIIFQGNVNLFKYFTYLIYAWNCRYLWSLTSVTIIALTKEWVVNRNIRFLESNWIAKYNNLI